MELWILWRTTSVKLHLLATLIPRLCCEVRVIPRLLELRSSLQPLCWFCFRNPIPLASPVPCPWHFAACFIYLFLTINFIKFKLLRQEKCYLTSKVLFYLSFWCWITKALFLISAFSDQRNRSRDNSDCD